MRRIRSLLGDRGGASAAEFALVLPLFIVLILGVVDAGRLLWELNTIKKATQVGARMAVVIAPVDTSIATETYVGHDPGSGVLTQGDIIPANALGAIECDDTQCTCTVSPCKGSRVYNSTAFDAVVARMNNHFDRIADTNVTITYSGSGLGFAGDPGGPDLSPTVEVELSGLTFTPVTALLFADVTLPPIRTSMTGEDQAGAQSY